MCSSDLSGVVTFTSIFPACYSGRWPHIHFEVYPTPASAGVASNRVKTSQIALPTDACNQVFASSGYETSVSNFAQVSLARDNVFSDGYSLELGSASGSVAAGYVVTLDVNVAAQG